MEQTRGTTVARQRPGMSLTGYSALHALRSMSQRYWKPPQYRPYCIKSASFFPNPMQRRGYFIVKALSILRIFKIIQLEICEVGSHLSRVPGAREFAAGFFGSKKPMPFGGGENIGARRALVGSASRASGQVIPVSP